MFMRARSLSRDTSGWAAVGGMASEAAAKSSDSMKVHVASADLRHCGIGVEEWSDSDADEVTVGDVKGDRDTHGSTSTRASDSRVSSGTSSVLCRIGVFARSPAMSSHTSNASVNSFVSSSRGSEVDRPTVATMTNPVARATGARRAESAPAIGASGEARPDLPNTDDTSTLHARVRTRGHYYWTA